MTDHDLHNKEISIDLYERKRLNTLVGVNKEVTLKLGKAGYSFMKDLVKVARTKADRQKLSDELSIPYDDLYRIVLCSDMAQVVGLSGKILCYLYESGYQTLESLKSAQPDEINRAVLAYLAYIGKKPTLPSCSRPGNWIGAARLTDSLIELD